MINQRQGDAGTAEIIAEASISSSDDSAASYITSSVSAANVSRHMLERPQSPESNDATLINVRD